MSRSGNNDRTSRGISLVHVKKCFRTRNPPIAALDGLSMEAPPGQITVIMGTNGSGKSTLLRIASGADLADSGELFVDGQSYEAVGRGKLRRYIAFLTQNPLLSLFPGFTIHEMARAYLDGTGIPVSPVLEKLNQSGISSGARSRELSGGQQQLLALELLLARQPRALLLDEPTASLDPSNSRKVRSRLREIKGGDVVVILVSHDVEEASAIADQLVILHNGALHLRIDAADDRLNSADFIRDQLLLLNMIAGKNAQVKSANGKGKYAR